MSKIAITDYIEIPSIEKEILGDLVSTKVTNETEVILVWHKQINKEYISKLPKLKGVQRYGVGYDNLDLDMLKNKNIIACNNPDYGVDEVSDTAIAMILNIARGITQYNELAKSYFDSWQKNVISTIRRNSDITVGIVGAGRIGGTVLLKCNSLKFKTVFYDKYKERGHDKLLSSIRVNSLKELLNVSDIISLHTPLTIETVGMVNLEFLNEMKKGGSLVNTARGALFSNCDLLYNAMRTNQLNQLAIDVLPNEPPNSGKFINAWRKSEEWINGRLIINPHTAYYSKQSYREMRLKAAENALRIYYGQEPFNIL
jgi:phosphoglycerate dehydrogenase-like enzyme